MTEEMKDDSLMKGNISSELEFDVKFENKEAMISLGYAGKGGSAGIYGKVSAEYLIDKLAEAIPGQVDDKIFALLKAAI